MKSYHFILFLLLIFSCKSHKDLSKSQTKENTSTKTETAITQTISEQADTTIKTREVTAEAIKELEKLIEGDSAFTDTPELIITTKIVKGQVKTVAKKKAQEIPVKINKVTVTKLDQNSATISKTETAQRKVHKERIWNFNWLWLILVLIAAYFGWRFKLFHR